VKGKCKGFDAKGAKVERQVSQRKATAVVAEVAAKSKSFNAVGAEEKQMQSACETERMNGTPGFGAKKAAWISPGRFVLIRTNPEWSR